MTLVVKRFLLLCVSGFPLEKCPEIKQMKVVFVGGQSVPGIGGVESYIFNIAKALNASGHEAVIVCSDRTSFETTVEGVEIVHIKCPKSNMTALPLLFMKSLRYIFKNRCVIDVVNFQSIFFAFLPGWIAALCGCHVCYTIHSLAEDNPKHGWPVRAIMRLAAFVSIWCCGRNILTVSCSKAREVKSRYGRNCSVIPCGVDIPVLSANSDILWRFNLAAGGYYLTIGRIDPVKNIDVLIEAFRRRGKREYKLVIAGDYANSYGSSLLELAGGSEDILFIGSVMGEDKDCLLRNCFANCLVSSSEGMPISLLEGMACGKPSIVTDIPAIHEVLREEWGCWCSVGDTESLAAQMEYVERNRSVVTAACASHMAAYIVENHTWDKIATKYLNYLYSLGIK